MTKSKKQQRAEALAEIGRLGGMAGTGDAKRRGNSAHYRRLSKLAADARARKRAEEAADGA